MIPTGVLSVLPSLRAMRAVSQDILDRGRCNSNAPELASPGHRPGRGPVAPTGP